MRNIRKVSTALRIGREEAEANNITHTRYNLFKVRKSGKICGACFLGEILIGKVGLTAAQEIVNESIAKEEKKYDKNTWGYGNFDPRDIVFGPAYKTVQKLFPVLNQKSKNECIRKNLPSTKQDKVDIKGTLADTFVDLNDEVKLKPEQMVEILESCNL